MPKSMTGFARCQGENQELTVIWECRSVNHRYLDLNFRLPEQLRSLESSLREKVALVVKRGKLDLGLRYELKKSGSMDLRLNASRVQQLFHLQSNLSQHHSTITELSTADILAFPGVLEEPVPQQDSMDSLALAVLDDTLNALNKARAAEGNRIVDFISQRAVKIAEHINALRELLPEIRANLREKVLGKLLELEQKPDQDRLEQELVFYAQRLDVDEELDRLDSHLTELNKSLKLDKPVGRRLDFLMQEFNREANTLASKSQHSSSTQHAVELKVLIEQMREQIQNIE